MEFVTGFWYEVKFKDGSKEIFKFLGKGNSGFKIETCTEGVTFKRNIITDAYEDIIEHGSYNPCNKL